MKPYSLLFPDFVDRFSGSFAVFGVSSLFVISRRRIECGSKNQRSFFVSITFMVSGEAHLHRMLKTYAAYYDEVRTHLALDRDAPD